MAHVFAANGIDIVRPLRVFLEEHMAGAKRRTKRVASNRATYAGK